MGLIERRSGTAGPEVCSRSSNNGGGISSRVSSMSTTLGPSAAICNAGDLFLTSTRRGYNRANRSQHVELGSPEDDVADLKTHTEPFRGRSGFELFLHVYCIGLRA